MPKGTRDAKAVLTAASWDSREADVSVVLFDKPLNLLVAANGLAKSPWVVVVESGTGALDPVAAICALDGVPDEIGLVIGRNGMMAFRRGVLVRFVAAGSVVAALRQTAEASGVQVEEWKHDFCTQLREPSSRSSSDTARPN